MRIESAPRNLYPAAVPTPRALAAAQEVSRTAPPPKAPDRETSEMDKPPGQREWFI